MNQEDKRKREAEPMHSNITTAEWIRLVGIFDEAIKIRDIVDAVTHAVIEGQCIKHKQDFNNFLEPGSGDRLRNRAPVEKQWFGRPVNLTVRSTTVSPFLAT